MGYEDPNTFRGLRTQNVKRCNETYHHLDTWGVTDWACAVAGETGELCNVVKKIRRLEDGEEKSYNHGANRDDLVQQAADELADVVIYVDLLAAKLEIDLGRAVVEKFNRTSEKVGSKVRLPY